MVGVGVSPARESRLTHEGQIYTSSLGKTEGCMRQGTKREHTGEGCNNELTSI